MRQRDNCRAELAPVSEISNIVQCLSASNIRDEDNQDNSIIVDVSLSINMKPPMEWWIDGLATSRMSCDINWFGSLKPMKYQRVELANDKLVDVKGSLK